MKKTDYKAQIQERIDALKELLNAYYPEATEEIADFDEPQFRELEPITADEWALTHPLRQMAASDKFYAALATKLQKEFVRIPIGAQVRDEAIPLVAMMMAAYLEDIVSETGIWQATRNLYKARFGATLPFYDIDPDNYFEDDINMEDLKLLCWIAFNRAGASCDMSYSPISPGWEMLAEVGFEILVDNFEKAPVCSRAARTLLSILQSGDYYKLRSLGLWLSADCPLTNDPELRFSIIDSTESFLRESEENETPISAPMAAYISESSAAWAKYMSMLGCPASKYLAEIARIHNMPEMAAKLETVKTVSYSAFQIVDSDSKYFHLVDLAGQKFNVCRSSFKTMPDLHKRPWVLTSLAQFGNEYVVSGMAVFTDSKPSYEEITTLSEFPEEKLEELRRVVKKHRGQRVFYLRSVDEISELLEGAMTISCTEDGANIEPQNLVLLISDTVAPVVIPDRASCFKDRKNPFYDSSNKELNGKKAWEIVGTYAFADDVIDYIVEKKLLSDATMYASQGKRVAKRITQDNLAFLMRFYRSC